VTGDRPEKHVTVRTHEVHRPGAVFRYGMELILDLHMCDADAIAYGNGLVKFAQDLVELIGMKAYPINEDEPTWARYFGEASDVTRGFTVIQPIETSSITMHLSEGLVSAHINVFSCQTFDAQAAIDAAVTHFQPSEVVATVLER